MEQPSHQIENKALREYIYEQIRSLIENNGFELGKRINKLELAKRFSVSQTPVNDALNRLVGENYLIQESRKGYYLREFSLQEQFDYFEMRAGLEGISAKLCCERATDEEISVLCGYLPHFKETCVPDRFAEYARYDREFHEKILAFAKNPAIIDAMKSTGFMFRTYQKGLVRTPDLTLAEHEEIIAALHERNGKRAQEAMEAHLFAAREIFASLIAEQEKQQEEA
jgi:DNA-binding GntR family transcriptional regulator